MKLAKTLLLGLILFVVPLIFGELYHRKLYYRLGHTTGTECVSGTCPVIRTTCAVLCQASGQCVSFNYRPPDGACQFNTQHFYQFGVSMVPSNLWEYFGPKYQNVKDNDWILVFLARSGIKVSVSAVWNINGLAHDVDLFDQDPALFSKYGDQRSTHYRTHWLDVWGSAAILQVKLVLYYNGTEVTTLLFDGAGSAKDDWFSPSRLVSSPWSDLPGASPAIFSSDGQIDRSFYISSGTNYFDCHDRKWLIVLDEWGNQCNFEKYDKPQFQYALGSTNADFQNGGFGLAETMAVFIKVA